MTRVCKLISVCLLSSLFLNPPIGAFSPEPALHHERRHIGTRNETSKLRKPDRERLVRAWVSGEPALIALIASVTGGNETAAREITRLGGKVRRREDSIDYIRAEIPTPQVESVARLGAVQTILLDDSRTTTVGLDSSRDEIPNFSKIAGAPRYDVPAPDRNTPAENPYLPTRDIGAPQFIKANPTFDGRGVGIAIIDFFPDILVPELQTAKTLDGKSIPKIADVGTSADPADGKTPFAVSMSDEVRTADGNFSYQDVKYHAPAEGIYRVGLFSRRQPAVAVLWNEKENTVWVDTDQDRNFADEKAMIDYNFRYDVGTFGIDDPLTPKRESLGFVIKTYPQKKYIDIFRGNGNHGTMTSSAAAGKAFFGGAMNGSAPEAQIIPFAIRGGSSAYPTLEEFILAAKHPKVDLISASVGVGPVVRVDDGQTTVGVVIDRLVEKYKKPIFIPAGNARVGLNTTIELGNGDRAISVGGYLRKESWRAIFGVDAFKEEYIENMSSRGPAEDGGFKPDIVVPANGISSWPGGGSRPGTDKYKLPPGYATGGGTSYACPIAAGSAALLISAAKQAGVPYDPQRIKWAMKSSARFILGYGANEQGAGLVNIPAAWELLKQAPLPVVISTEAPVNTAFSQYLNKPGLGRGIYERDRWSAGQNGERKITFTRRSGDAKPVEYEVSWIGDDGTFRSEKKISLPLNKSVSFRLAVNPKTEGVHSAILVLVDPKTGYPIHQVMNTVVASAPLVADNGFSVVRSGQAEWLGYKSFFVDVPAGASALKFEMDFDGEGAVRVDIHDPSNFEYLDRPNLPNVIPGGVFSQRKGQLQQTLMNPAPGVWEVNVQNGDIVPGRNGGRPFPMGVTLKASVIRAEATSTSSSASIPENGSTQTITLSNSLAGFRGNVLDTPLASVFTGRPIIAEGGAPKVYEMDVPPGTQMIAARINGATDKSADLDLYLYDCTAKEAILRDYATGPDSIEEVSIPNPAPGKWKVVVDPAKVPSGRTAVAYQDMFTNPSYGTLSSKDALTYHRSGEKWNAAVSLETGKSPEDNRRLAAIAEVGSGRPETVGVQRAKFYKSAPALSRVPLGRTMIVVGSRR